MYEVFDAADLLLKNPRHPVHKLRDIVPEAPCTAQGLLESVFVVSSVEGQLKRSNAIVIK